MNKHTRFLLICLAACGMVAPLWAQDSPAKDWPYRVEVFGAFGNGRLYNGDSLWGSGLDYGGGIGVRPFSGWMKRIGFESVLFIESFPSKRPTLKVLGDR